jgi:ankyrin repeat protein
MLSLEWIGVWALIALAASGNCEAVVRLLLSKGVDVDPVCYRGTPLHLAASNDKDQVVKILLEHGADVSC